RRGGTHGGLSTSGAGRRVCIAAAPPAWDSAHAVIASMGPPFVIIRSSARIGRTAAGKRAIRNAGTENAIREEISQAVATLIADAKLSPRDAALMQDEEEKLIAAADIVTRARTEVETDFRGNVIDAHEPEMPTRFAKQLALIFRGALSIGIGRTPALALALRCARDSIPPIRLGVLKDLAANNLDDCRIINIAKRLRKPWTTIRRTLDALYVLELVNSIEVDEKDEDKDKNKDKDEDEDGKGKPKRKVLLYELAADVDLSAL